MGRHVNAQSKSDSLYVEAIHKLVFKSQFGSKTVDFNFDKFCYQDEPHHSSKANASLAPAGHFVRNVSSGNRAKKKLVDSPQFHWSGESSWVLIILKDANMYIQFQVIRERKIEHKLRKQNQTLQETAQPTDDDNFLPST